jgi:hypothetical protein
MGEFIFIVIVIYILYKIFGGGKKEKPNKNYDPNDFTKQPSPDDNYFNMDDYLNDVPKAAYWLVNEYNKAYDSKIEDDIETKAALLIDEHFRASKEKKIDECILYERAARERPYHYFSWAHSILPHSKEMDIGMGNKDLYEILQEQNYYIQFGKESWQKAYKEKEKSEDAGQKWRDGKERQKKVQEKNDNQNKKDVKTSNENQSKKKKGVVATDFENNDNSFTHEEFDDYINGAVKVLPQTTKNLISSYKKAYDACNEKQLENIVNDMIKYHEAVVSLHKTTDRELLEKAVEARPYKYRGKNKKGEDLFTLFWKQNKEVEKRDGYI